MKNETFILTLKDGHTKYIYCKKSELLDYISVNDYRNTEKIEILNRATDTTKHKIIDVNSL